ncbi:MAG: hypothetical protein ACOX8Q_05165 [Christensenellales bacterium]
MNNLTMSDNLDAMELSLEKAKIVLEGVFNDIDEKTMFAKEHGGKTAVKGITGWALDNVLVTELDIVHDYINKTLENLRALMDDLNAERKAEQPADTPAA